MNQNPTITATQINYYFVCHRELWLFSHQINMEQNSELVELGKLLHESSYQREKKEIQIGPIKIDFIGRDGVIHEIKKTPSVEQAHAWQVKYYIWYLKQLGVNNLRGEIDYPKLKKRTEIELLPEDKVEIVEILRKIEEIINAEEVPPVLNKSLCKKCSYYELCYV
ncbi:MAG TPA: CRISPR-associated protein Cas4 [Candidatus Cloacimonadota bacterium]|nr:CRISPR-associated protein Cas4 [Candidatus Cloacimonadota bacterium]